jgi:Ca2+-transporting ATPase
MATLHDAGDGRRIVYVKGAVEKVLERCEKAIGGVTRSGGGALVPLDADAVHGVVDVLAAEGLRVLAFARGELPAGRSTLSHDDVAGGLVFLGLQAMIDPPRPEAITAVAACRAAGVTVKMITGDHAVTAAAIARQIGLTDEENPQAVTGAEMALLHDKDLIDVAAQSNVFARVTPEQKLRLVEALQATGNVVAMTGDGVNDAPALKQADIGVAMGMAGTDVAKEAADMVLTDDNFASIEAAVEEGRGVFDNLVKFIAYALPTNVGQGLVLLTAIFVGVTLPILPLQILWINMTTAVLLGLGLAFEAKEPGIMARPPRAPGSPILSRPIITRIVFMGLLLLAGAFGLFEWAQAQGYSDAEARTVAVNTFLAVQIFYLFNCRSMRRSLFRLNPFGNLAILGGVAVMIVLQLLFTYASFMHVAFDSASIPAEVWAVIVGVGVAAMLLMEALGWVQRRARVV